MSELTGRELEKAALVTGAAGPMGFAAARRWRRPAVEWRWSIWPVNVSSTLRVKSTTVLHSRQT